MMKKDKIFYKTGDCKISYSQTSKGIWYCNDLTIYCKDIFDGISVMEQAMIYSEEVLKQRNTSAD